jgi:hypothetical protein
VTEIVDPWPWLEKEIAELDRRYAPELEPLRKAVREAKGHKAKKEAKAALAPVMDRYLGERREIEIRAGLPWVVSPMQHP